MRTKNFKEEEFACKCGCGLAKISPTLMLIAQMIRDKYNIPVYINSGTRCEKHNLAVGGVQTSQHKVKGDGYSHAFDFNFGNNKIDLQEVRDWLNKIFPNCLGVGIYDTFIHVDDRMDRAYRWDNRKKLI